jgi:DNA polymerase/3'-5' exonuclease PolX
MSTATKRPLAEAKRDAEEFQALFADCFERWTIAGSIRRKKPECGDAEHVVIPRFGDTGAADLFGNPVTANLLLRRCDELIYDGIISKHVYAVNYADGTTGTRNMWGDVYRGCSFKGGLHEIYCADASNYGAILCIRTGPGDFSQMMVSRLHGTMLRQVDGYLKYADGHMYPCPTEEHFFKACNVRFIPPEARGA